MKLMRTLWSKVLPGAAMLAVGSMILKRGRSRFRDGLRKVTKATGR